MTILRLTDGTSAGTIDFSHHTQANRAWMLAKDTWTPKVATRRRATFGGRSPYNDVTEEITVHVFGMSEGDALTRLEALHDLLLQAERFADNEDVSPVRLQYMPTGGKLVYECLIYGRGDGDGIDSALQVTPTFHSRLRAFTIENIRIRVVRSGLWIDPTPETATVGSAVSNPGVITATFTSTPDVPSPIKIELTGFTYTNNTYQHPSALLVCNSKVPVGGSGATTAGTNLAVKAASTMTATNWTSVAESAANKSVTGNILRYTPVSTGASVSGVLTDSVVSTEVTILLTVRASIAGNFSIRIGRAEYSSGIPATLQSPVYSSPVVVTVASTVQLIPFTFPQSPDVIQSTGGIISIEATAAASSGTLDIDSVIIMPTSTFAEASLLAFDANTLMIPFSGAYSLVAWANPLAQSPYAFSTYTGDKQYKYTGLDAFVGGRGLGVLDTDLLFPMSYQGTPELYMQSTSLAVLWVSAGSAVNLTVGSIWRYTDTAAAVQSVGISVTRNAAYVVPR